MSSLRVIVLITFMIQALFAQGVGVSPSVNKNSDAFVIYKVKAGDQLGKILDVLGFCPLWGHDKKVSEIIELNLNEIKKNGDLIRAGTLIKLPKNDISEFEDFNYLVSGKIILSKNYYNRCPKPRLRSNSLASIDKLSRLPAQNSAKAEEVSVSLHPKVDSPVMENKKVAEEKKTESQKVEPQKEEFNKTQADSWFELSPVLQFTKISASDLGTRTKATLLSKLNMGADLAWRLAVSDNWQAGLHLGFMQHRFADLSAGSTKTLQGMSSTANHFGLSGRYLLSPKSRLLFSASEVQKIFIRSVTTTNVMAEVITIPNFEFGYFYDFLIFHSVTAGIALNAGMGMPTSTDIYTIQQGTSSGVSIYFRQDLAGKSYQANFGYQQDQQSTSITDQTRTDLNVEFRIIMPLFK